MTIITNNAEGGTDGVAVTTANSGGTSGTAFALATSGHTVFKAAAKAHGSLGYEVNTTASTGYVALSGTGTGSFAAQAYVRFGTLPGGTDRHRFLSIMNSAGTYFLAALDMSPTGAVEVTSSSGFIATAGTTLQAGAWYRVHLSGTNGASGSVRLIVQNGSGSGSSLIDQTWTRDMSTNVPSLFVMGQANSTSVSGFWFDDMSWQPDSSAEIAANPIAASTATVKPNAGVDFTAEPGQKVWLMARGQDSANGLYVKTGTWSQVSGPSVTLTPSTSSDGVSMVSFTVPQVMSTSTITLRLTQSSVNTGLTAYRR